MAAYAEVLRVLTCYDTIDGREMAKEALSRRLYVEKTFVDELIDFAVNVAKMPCAAGYRPSDFGSGFQTWRDFISR